MEALGWTFVGLVSIAWLALFHAVRKPVAHDQAPLPPAESPKPRSTRSRRLWLDYKPPFAWACAMSRRVGMFKYVVLGGVAGLDVALWIALVSRLVSWPHVDELREAVERAILAEALTGATRTELWLAARIASRFVTVDQVGHVVNKLMATGQLEKTTNRWTTTTAGRARLDRSTA